MKVRYSKYFEKAVRKLSGKRLDSVRDMITEVKAAQDITEVTDCKKLVGYEFVYRIHVGNYRAFFNLHVEVKDGTVVFLYLVPRGQAYAKKIMSNLRRNDI